MLCSLMFGHPSHGTANLSAAPHKHTTPAAARVERPLSKYVLDYPQVHSRNEQKLSRGRPSVLVFSARTR